MKILYLILKKNELETIIIFLNKYIKCIKHPILRLQNYVEKVIPSYTDVQFKSHFRMKRTTFHHILHLIKPSLLRSKSGRKTLSPEKQFLIAIWKMATPDSYRSISEKFNPQGNRAQEVMMGFTVASAFPRIIGAIDGTHINIRAPHVSPECYVNRKGHHSIQLQAVCDHERRFIHCVAGHVGSVHDQRVFRLSEVHNYLQDPRKFSNDSYLVGDAAYSLHENLMTPYRDNGHLTHKQKNYNFCHSSARMVIERTFGLLKGRFRSLLTFSNRYRFGTRQ
ncbi:putative nuclease HARBI1 [Temnothorax nylanderi]|uniref:putative nuclease HARBI1 n=1 Tax=Temnothorax nylanderi TaxID=102681 RepID=UPI003A8C67D7